MAEVFLLSEHYRWITGIDKGIDKRSSCVLYSQRNLGIFPSDSILSSVSRKRIYNILSQE